MTITRRLLVAHCWRHRGARRAVRGDRPGQLPDPPGEAPRPVRGRRRNGRHRAPRRPGRRREARTDDDRGEQRRRRRQRRHPAGRLGPAGRLHGADGESGTDGGQPPPVQEHQDRPLHRLRPRDADHRAPLVVVVPKNSPHKTIKELVEHAQKNPGKLTYGSAGNGSASHLATVLLAQVRSSRPFTCPTGARARPSTTSSAAAWTSWSRPFPPCSV